MVEAVASATASGSCGPEWIDPAWWPALIQGCDSVHDRDELLEA